MSCRVAFPGTQHPPLDLPEHSNLSEHLDVHNSPVLFGCRTGICGTCAIHVKGSLAAPSREERETLDLVAPGEADARLACQLDLTNDIEIFTR